MVMLIFGWNFILMGKHDGRKFKKNFCAFSALGKNRQKYVLDQVKGVLFSGNNKILVRLNFEAKKN